ncbi:MAG: hypothetical protein WCT12_27400 [Verrucomicrobiota bacterium]
MVENLFRGYSPGEHLFHRNPFFILLSVKSVVSTAVFRIIAEFVWLYPTYSGVVGKSCLPPMANPAGRPTRFPVGSRLRGMSRVIITTFPSLFPPSAVSAHPLLSSQQHE